MQADTAILVERLRKRYRLGQVRNEYPTLRESIASAARTAAGWLHARGPVRPGSDAGTDTIWALDDVSFSLRQGEVVGVIGSNGAGKTTLLKVLSRITEPTSGHAWVRGRLGSLLEVGSGFHLELTGRENVFLNGAILGMRRREIRRRFDEIVAFAELERFIDTPVKFYSTGMYLRLAFAVAAHLEPEILLVDEVLAVGDASFQQKCLAKMDEVARQGRTVLFVSHNLIALENACSGCAPGAWWRTAPPSGSSATTCGRSARPCPSSGGRTGHRRRVTSTCACTGRESDPCTAPPARTSTCGHRWCSSSSTGRSARVRAWCPASTSSTTRAS
jgi:lipopolysaccharide transport system ATP-binding protein